MSVRQSVALFLFVVLAGLPGRAFAQRATAEEIAEAARLFPDAGAVVLTWNWTLELNPKSDGLWAERVRVLIRTADGFDHANRLVQYDAATWDLEEFEAWTELPDGRRIDVPRELQRERQSARSGDVKFHAIRFAFPAVQPGVTLTWRVRYGKRSPWWIGWFKTDPGIPVLQAMLSARIKGGRPEVSSRFPLEPACRAERKDYTYQTDLTVTCRGIGSLSNESSAPPAEDRRFALRIEVNPDVNVYWDRVARNAIAGARAFLKERSAAGPAAARAADGAADDREKIDRVLEFLRSTMRVDDSVPAEGVTLDRALERKEADSWQLACVAFAMLRSLGMDVALVLTSDRTDGAFSKALTWDQGFRRVLVHVDTPALNTLLDPACLECRSGMPDWYYMGEGSGGLRFDPDREVWDLIALGRTRPSLNLDRVVETVTIGSDGTQHVEGRHEVSGQAEVAARRTYSGLTAAEVGRRYCEEGLGLPEADASVTAMSPTDRSGPFTVRYSSDTLLRLASAGPLLIARPSWGLPSDWVLDDEVRQEPVWKPYPRTAVRTTRVRVPEGWLVSALPDPVVLSGPGHSFRGLWSYSSEQRTLQWEGTFVTNGDSVPPAAYAQARRFVGEVPNALRDGVLLRPNPARAARRPE